MAIVNFFGGLMDIDQKGTPAMPVKHRVNSDRNEKPTPLQMSARGFLNGVRSPVKVANTLMRYAPSIVQQIKDRAVEQQRAAKQTVPMTRFNLETSPHRVFDATWFDLQDFKAMRGLVKGCLLYTSPSPRDRG